MALLQVKHVKKIYTTRFGGNQVQALSDVDFSVDRGEYVAVMGESGSGKTTLLNILATLDKPTTGDVYLDGKQMTSVPDKQLAAFRRENLGFVFQDFNLLDTFSIRDNIFLPLVLAGKKYPEMEKQLESLVRSLGIEKILDKFPYEVSGGQKQRTAVARALITNPQIILADEPTGALDSKSSDQLLDIFEEINRKGETILMVTHSTRAASHANRILFIKDGVVYHQIYKGDMSNEEMYESISNTLTLLATGGQKS
ncbi:ABC transporter ATP-binding protein [Blautia liquoris]|uniref:ABC transporter ATP-binding protein n=1 Tax=Blautia liquoris TaxID=2779518 RepID=A0A7M2RJ05_9FIRM|nr:ABC transporter ATP-binding protein [Blautia liquoris]QOV20285.1 ABC transporter ATP-binding protein [Blautia liquoris]